MSENKVITAEEMKSIEQLKSSSTDLIFEFGQTELEIIMTDKRLNDLKSHKESLEQRYAELQSQELQLVNDLNKKYGPGTLNIENGEFVAT